MTTQIYTMGYEGRKPAELLRVAEQLDATIVDIRLRATSAHPQWREGALRELLGDHYARCAQLGNTRYREPAGADGPRPIEIADFDAGAAYVLENSCPVILMCSCRQLTTCHRLSVVQLLWERHRVECRELDWDETGGAPKSVGIYWLEKWQDMQKMKASSGEEIS
ncbi:MAG: hypothetical protein ABIY70_08780 [Capsulimonas sp.]|uniref:hypothetical protein n=1 Tax=Capsulimonas sp. TaxID=2494211 RepID=UPI0032631DBF